jgi:hypothetical protein
MGRDVPAALATGGGGAVCRLTILGSWSNMMPNTRQRGVREPIYEEVGMIKELVHTCRSYRRFYEDHALDEETLRELVDLARLGASGHNVQPLKYMLFWQPEKNALIFPHLTWAGYLKD